jgi:prepilin-type N-terminal cleavage/methylation domain-containing protein
MNATTKGFSLTETMIALVLGSLLIIALFHTFSGGIGSMQKGGSHLSNMQSAAIILAQIEKDLALMTSFLQNHGDATAGVSWELVDDFGQSGQVGTATVRYDAGPGQRGYRRTLAQGAQSTSHVFSSDLFVEVQFTKVTVPPTNRAGYCVEVAVSRPPDRAEKNTLKRFIYCYNHPQNFSQQTHQWTW